MRKIIQICGGTLANSSIGDKFNISALCNDGTLWYLNDLNKGWFKYPEIPKYSKDFLELYEAHNIKN